MLRFLANFKRFIPFYRQAVSVYRVHSPLLYDFIVSVFQDKRHYYAFDWLSNLYRQLRQDDTLLEVQDFGAGSKLLQGQQRKVSAIAATSLSPPRKAEFLFRLVAWHRPKRILEMGTCLGFSTLYLRHGALSADLHTMEGCEAYAQYAQTLFKRMAPSSPVLHVGPFEQTLPGVVAQLKDIDLVFLDGNHRSEPLLAYFEAILPKLSPAAIVVVDDIRWSDDMLAAWKSLSQHDSVRMSVDLGQMGLLFMHPSIQHKQSVCLVKPWLKPWQLGFKA